MQINTIAATTNAPVEAVWQLWTNPRYWSRWDPDIAQAEMKGAFKQGATGTITHHDGTTSTFQVMSCEIHRSYVMSVQVSKGVELLIKRECQPEGDFLKMQQELTLIASPFTKLLFAARKDAMQKNALKAMDNMWNLLQGDLGFIEGLSGQGQRVRI